MSHVKKYDVGQIRLDLLKTPDVQDCPYMQYTHELQLLSFGDVQHSVNLSLVFNYERYRNEKATGENPFFIAPGFKLNLQKRLLYTQFGVFTNYQEGSGNIVELNNLYGYYTFDDDSQRIIRQKAQPRQTGSISEGNIEMGGDDPVYDYFLEYPDFSKEKYSEAGRLLAVYDKYSDDAVLAYTYDTSGRLTAITFRNGKDITLAYDTSNRLTSITYNNYTTTLHYTNGMLDYVKHYTGVKYDYSLTQADCALALGLTDTPASDLKVTATATEDSETVSYAKQLKLTDNGQIVEVIDYVGTNTVNKVTYKFPKSLLYDYPPFGYVDVIDHNGVETRIQFHNNKMLCSYELQNSQPKFESETALSRYVGNITLYNTADGSDNNSATGVQTRYSGLQLGYTSTLREWSLDITSYILDEGYYTLTGWVKSNADNVDATTINIVNAPNSSLNLDLEPNGQWKFFSIMFRMAPSWLKVYASGDAQVSTRDFRITFQKSEELTNGDQSHTNMAEAVLLNGDSEISFNDARFFFNANGGHTEIMSSNGQKKVLTFPDVLRFKMRQKREGLSNEVYCNKCKHMIVGVNDLEVLFNNAYVSISNFDIGIKTFSGLKESLTKFHVLTEQELASEEIDNLYMIKTCTVGETLVSREKLDINLDVLQSLSDGVTTNYVRDAQGRITEESVAGLYKRRTTYTNATVTVEDVNPSTDATISTVKYYLYSTWGVVYKTEVRDSGGVRRVMTKDTFDNSKQTLLTRAFGNNLTRENNFTYAKGMLDAVSDGSLNYHYAYNGMGDLESVIGNNETGIEHHAYSRANGETTVESKYPMEDGALHTEKQIFDKYGRLASIEGVLENTYSLDPYWYYFISETDHEKTMDQYDRDEHGELSHDCAKVNGAAVDCKDAVLSQISDKLTGETTKYGYANGLLTAAVTRNAANALLRQETFVYDKIGRVTENRFDYDGTNDNCVINRFTYLYHETDPLANQQLDEHIYEVDGVTKALTRYDYDAYSRITKKRHTIGDRIFQKQFMYTGNKTSSTYENIGGRTNYLYDDLGRIIMITDGTPISYVYDTYGQLTRENNKVLDKTFVYEYNDTGSITKVKEYAYTTETPSGTATETTFAYDSTYPDRLTGYGSTSISYNSMGCPTTVNGYSATWTRGKLSGLAKGLALTGRHVYGYSYNAFGQRIGSSYTFTPGTSSSASVAMGTLTQSNRTYKYDNSGRLIVESNSSTYYGEGNKYEKVVYLYDESNVIGMLHTVNDVTSTYYFRRNLLGDVIGIYDTSGAKVAGYAYDAWGNCTITSDTTKYDVAHANPIRYRGYYYDEDTKLYYLNARYYCPEWRRFISPDDTAYLDPESVNGLNLYAYCNNDPVNYADPSGNSIIASILIGAAIGAIISGGFSLASELYQNNLDWSKVNWNLVAVDTIFGAIDGALSVMGLSVAASLLIQPALAGIQTAIGAAVSGETLTVGQVVNAMVFSALMIGASSALYNRFKFKTGYDTFENHQIRNTMDDHLKTAKLQKRIDFYKSKSTQTRIDGLVASLGYIGFTSTSTFLGVSLGL